MMLFKDTHIHPEKKLHMIFKKKLFSRKKYFSKKRRKKLKNIYIFDMSIKDQNVSYQPIRKSLKEFGLKATTNSIYFNCPKNPKKPKGPENQRSR